MIRRKQLYTILRLVTQEMQGKYRYNDFLNAFINYLVEHKMVDAKIKDLKYIDTDYDYLYEAASSFWENILKRRTH